MEQQVDAALVQAVQAVEQQHVVRPRVRSVPRPPEQLPREPVALTSDDLCIGYFSLTAAMIGLAEADLRYRCLPGCLTKDDCSRRRLSARLFLAGLRAGRSSTIWSDWVRLAEARARP